MFTASQNSLYRGLSVLFQEIWYDFRFEYRRKKSIIDSEDINLAKRKTGLNKNVSFKDQQLPRIEIVPSTPHFKENSYQDIEQQTGENSTENQKSHKWSNEGRSSSCSQISEKAEDEFCTYNTEYYV